jgi:cell division protein FtsZ
MGIGLSRGADRAVQAAELAISSPLLEASIDGAHGVLLSISGGSDLGLFEINEAARLVQEAAHPEANIIFGAVIDDALGDEVRVTVIAAGFDGGSPSKRGEERSLSGFQSASSTRPATSNGASTNGVSSNGAHPSPAGPRPAVQPVQPVRHEPDPVPATAPAGSGAGAAEAGPRPAVQPVHRPPHTVTFDDADDLDVPDFLK